MKCYPFAIVSLAFAACLVIASTVSFAVDQTDSNPFRRGDETSGAEEAPVSDAEDATPLNDQQRKLSEELQLLKRAESRMGAKHPAIQEVRQKIANLTQQLDALAAVAAREKNQASPTNTRSITEMNDQQLRQIIQRMIVKIEQLEMRIETLERQRIVH